MKNFQKKGSEGTSTMIIFIALILTSVIGASVIIQTSSSLQSKSLDVGRQSQEKVTTGLEIVQLYVVGTQDHYINGGVDLFSIVVRSTPGAPSIKLDDVIIKFDTEVASQALTYTLGSNATESTYSANYVIRGTKYTPGYLVNGDTIRFDFYVQSGVNISEDTKGSVRIITNSGAVRPMDFHTPLAMVSAITYLHP